HSPPSRSERDLDQLGPARLCALPRHLGEPYLAEVTPRLLLDPGRIRLGAIRQPAYPDAGRKEPRRLLVLVVAKGEVREPDQHLGDRGGAPRLGRRLPGRDAVDTGLVEIVGQISEHVVKFRAYIRQLRVVAQQGGRDTELATGLLGVAVPASELSLG